MASSARVSRLSISYDYVIVKEILWELTEKILFQEIWAPFESLMKRDH